MALVVRRTFLQAFEWFASQVFFPSALILFCTLVAAWRTGSSADDWPSLVGPSEVLIACTGSVFVQLIGLLILVRGGDRTCDTPILWCVILLVANIIGAFWMTDYTLDTLYVASNAKKVVLGTLIVCTLATSVAVWRKGGNRG